MNSLISVIIPVFNVEKFLPRCVESVQKQTYTNIEIILVDDGSPDRCAEICDAYAEKDSRIRVIHKKNGGLSDARNAGMDIARGEYFCFIDSDDYIQPTMLEHMSSAIESSGAKLALCNLMCVDEKGSRVFDAQESCIQSGVFSAHELLPRFYQKLGWYYIVAWNKLYHRSLFEDIRFPFGKIHEDEYIAAQIIWNAQTIVCLESEEYIYIYQRKGSIMNSRKVRSHCDWLEALYQRFEFCKEKRTLADFTAETRAVYFRELNNLFLKPELAKNTTRDQRKKAKWQYAKMSGKTVTEQVNWILFQINPKLENQFVQEVRKIRG